METSAHDRTRLTGRSPGTSPRSLTRDGSMSVAAITDRSVLVLAPRPALGAGVADGTRVVRGAQREGVVVTAEQAGDLHACWIAGQDADEADRASSDATGSRDRSALFVALDRVQRHMGQPRLP